MSPSRPLTVALVDDYDVVLSGLSNMLKPYGDRVRIVELDATVPVMSTVEEAVEQIRAAA